MKHSTKTIFVVCILVVSMFLFVLLHQQMPASSNQASVISVAQTETDQRISGLQRQIIELLRQLIERLSSDKEKVSSQAMPETVAENPTDSDDMGSEDSRQNSAIDDNPSQNTENLNDEPADESADASNSEPTPEVDSLPDTQSEPEPEPKFSATAGFEGVTATDQLVGPGQWAGAQIWGSDSTIELSNRITHSGSQSLLLQSNPSGNQAPPGKAHPFASQWSSGDAIAMGLGSYVSAEFYVWLPAGDLGDLYIADWESASTGWPPQPGIRVGLWSNNRVTVERGKLGLPPVVTNYEVPREQWVKFQWRMRLGIGDDQETGGWTQLLIDDQEIITFQGTNYPDPAVASENGISLNAGYRYDRFKVGITASTIPGTTLLYLDDVSILGWEFENAPNWARTI